MEHKRVHAMKLYEGINQNKIQRMAKFLPNAIFQQIIEDALFIRDNNK